MLVTAAALLGASTVWAASAALAARSPARLRERRLRWQRARRSAGRALPVHRALPDGAGLPEVVEAVAAALRSGRSLTDALASSAGSAVPSLEAELAVVAARARHGVPVAEAVAGWARASRVTGAGLVGAAVGLCAGTGGDAARALSGVAATLREQRSLDREIRALSAQARSSAAVVALAPAAFTALAATADPATARFLLATPGGWACMAAGAALDLTGWRWMDRLAGSVR